MHLPQSTPRSSVFYDYAVHPYRPSPDRESGKASADVVIVGAGPIGLVTAIDLARFGVASIVLEQELQVSHGSRAIVLTRRSLEILQQAGVERRFRDKGLPWAYGRSYYRGHEVYRMVMPHDPDDRFMPGLNLQQQYIEQYLLEYCAASPLIDIRWGEKVVAIAQDATGATLTLDTPEGEYALGAPWVVAADGGRSTLRRLCGLRMEGRSYPGNFVIADIRAAIDLPTERLCFFDPPWNPGNNVLVHRQPDDMWRIDYRLPDGETPEQALEPARLSARIDAVLTMIGKPVPWQLDWATVYSANTLTLPDYVHGRVLFAGDAAHLLPIFGVRGCNTGLQDADNLAWKLAFVVRGWSPPGLLSTYTSERVQAAREICEEGGKSTRFMTPPTAGARTMRDAVLSLALSEDFPKDLLHWRTSRPHDYLHSPLNSDSAADAAFAGGPACGAPVRNVRLGPDDYLLDRLGAGAGFHVFVFTGTGGPDAAQRAILALGASVAWPLIGVVIGPREQPGEPQGEPRGDSSGESHGASAHAPLHIDDDEHRIAARYGARPGTVYLLRPDLHVCARWHAPSAADVRRALRNAVQAQASTHGEDLP